MDDGTPDLDAMLTEITACSGIKERMKAAGFTRCKCRCPRCKVKGAAIANLAGPRQHLHIRCGACGWMMME